MAREVAGLPNGSATAGNLGEDEQSEGTEEHDRDGTMASYRTAHEQDEESGSNTGSDEESGSDDGEGDDDDATTMSEATSGGDRQDQQQRRGSGHDRSKRPRAAQDIFQTETLAKVGCFESTELTSS